VRFGLSVINFGRYAEPATLIALARAAEDAGWDGLFLWDHLAWTWEEAGAPRTGDPWTLLAAVGCNTSRLLLGTNVTPLPRRRPHVVAQQVLTVNRLTGGRAVLGAGLGAVEKEFTEFGDDWDARVRARRLDDGLALFTAMTAPEARIPIWVGGASDAALRRAARYDGWTGGDLFDERGELVRPPETIRDVVTTLHGYGAGPGFDIVVAGISDGTSDIPMRCEAAGATWWVESIYGYRGTEQQMLEHVAAGP